MPNSVRSNALQLGRQALHHPKACQWQQPVALHKLHISQPLSSLSTVNGETIAPRAEANSRTGGYSSAPGLHGVLAVSGSRQQKYLSSHTTRHIRVQSGTNTKSRPHWRCLVQCGTSSSCSSCDMSQDQAGGLFQFSTLDTRAE